MTSCAVVGPWCFCRFFMTARMTFFPENNNMMRRYFALSCYTLARPIKVNIHKYKNHLVFWRQTGKTFDIC